MKVMLLNTGSVASFFEHKPSCKLKTLLLTQP